MAKGVKKIAYSENSRDIFTLRKRVKKITFHPYDYDILSIPADEFSYFKITEWFPETTQEDKLKPITWLEQNLKREVFNDTKKSKLSSQGLYGLKIQKKYAGVIPIYLEATLFGKPDKKHETGIYVFGHCSSKITNAVWSKEIYGKDVRGNHQFSYGNTVWLALQTEGVNGENKVKIEIYRAKEIGEVSSEDQQIDHIFAKVEKGEINIGISTTKWWRMDPLPRPIENYYVKVVDPQNKKSYISQGNTKTIARFLVLKGKDPQPSPYSVPTNTTPAKVGLSVEIFTQVESCRFEGIEIIEPKASPISIFNKETQPSTKNNSPKYEAKSQVFFFKNSTSYSLEHEGELLSVLQYVMENRLSIKIVGYASTDGDEKHNLELAKSRALVLQDFFLSSGMDAKTIRISYVIDRLSSNVIARRVDIIFSFTGHSAQALKYETIAPSSMDKNLSINIKGYKTHTCFIDDTAQKVSHKPKKIWSTYNFEKSVEEDSLLLPVKSKLSSLNVAPIFQYLWPSSSSCYRYSEIHIHSCRHYSDISKPTIALYVYPDIKWTLEFKWCHKYPFAYSHGNNLHPYDIEKGNEKIIGSELDRHWSESEGEMAQYFELSLKAKWNKNAQGKESQEAELGGKFGEKIAKTLSIFNKIKKTTQDISNSPLAKGKVMFEIKSPVIAVSAQWYLERAKANSPEVATMVVIGVDAKPLVEAEFTINIMKLFYKSADLICPGAGEVITWALEKCKKEAGIHFLIIFSGGIYVNGQTKINTLYPKETTGEIKATGKIQVTVEFKAWAKVEYTYLAVDGLIRANAESSITGGIEAGADKKGIYACPIAEFAGIKVTFQAVGDIKFGIFKRTLKYQSPPCILVDEKEIKFEKHYIN